MLLICCLLAALLWLTMATSGTLAESETVEFVPLNAPRSANEIEGGEASGKLIIQSVKEPAAGPAAEPATEPTTEPTAASLELPIKYWGNNFSGKFHRPSCPFAKSMAARHVVFFHFRREAIELGQKPCRYCLPPVVTRVECRLMPKAAEHLKVRGVSNEPSAAGQADDKVTQQIDDSIVVRSK